jgi:predicted phage terminase large subunit-like protein
MTTKQHRTKDDLFDDVLVDLGQRLVACVAERSEAQWRALRLVDWGRCLLPGYFRKSPSRMHEWLSDELDRMSKERGTRLNALAPRGSAKSTLATLAYVLRAAVEGREQYIWIVSCTIDQARKHLAHVKAELEQNEMLHAHYPRAAGRGRVWRRDAIELPNKTSIEAYGTEQKLRGRRQRQHRPSLIVCDDLQNDQQILSPMQRQTSRDWFHTALLKAGDGRTNVVNLATALHRDALAMQLARSPGWRSRVFQAIERWPERMDLWNDWEEFYTAVENADAPVLARQFFRENRRAMSAGAELLWPQHESLYKLMKMRIDEGHTAFEREKQNSPVDPEKCEWPESYFGNHIWLKEWPKKFETKVIALDPSKGADANHGDYSAFVMLGIDGAGVHYVEADLARRATPKMVEDGARLCRSFNPKAFGVEANQYQELLCAEFTREFQRRNQRVITPVGIHNYGNKVVRIRKLSSLLSRHLLRFRVTKADSTRMLVDQLRDFPLGTHDDGPDALEMAVRLTKEANRKPADDGLGDRLIAA